jgi:hypothetical protein
MTIKNFSLCVGIIFSCAFISLHADDEEIFTFDIDVFDDAATAQYLNSNTFSIKQSATPETIIELLKTFGVFDLLQLNFFRRTTVLNYRDVLDLPIFVNDYKRVYPCYALGVQFFYDQTSAVYFSPHHDEISHYIAIGSENVIEALDLSIKKIQTVFPSFMFPLIDLFDIFATTRVQERRIGGMFQFMRKFERAKLSCYLPFYYRERNYFLTEDDKEAIEALVGKSTQEDTEKLQREHLISDKLGFGDMRLMLDFPGIKKDTYKMRWGLFLTIPTAVAFVKGILGSSFKHRMTGQPSFSFTDIFELGSNPATQSEAVDQAVKFLLGSLDRLSAMVLDKELGNNGHLGIGGYVTTKMPLTVFIKHAWAEALDLKGRIFLEYLVPKQERRYFVTKNVAAAFEDRNFSDQSQAAQNLAFLEETFVNQFYPYVLDTVVHPGLIFMWTSKLTYETPSWAFHLGTDTWIQTPEHFGTIAATPTLLSQLDIRKDRNLWAYQSSILASLIFNINHRNDTTVVALNGSCVLASYGIGKEFTLGLTVEKNF